MAACGVARKLTCSMLLYDNSPPNASQTGSLIASVPDSRIARCAKLLHKLDRNLEPRGRNY